MDLRMTTLKAIIRNVNQTEVTELRTQLRRTLHQYCTVHTPPPPDFQCHTIREDCACQWTAQHQPIHITFDQDLQAIPAILQSLGQTPTTSTSQTDREDNNNAAPPMTLSPTNTIFCSPAPEPDPVRATPPPLAAYQHALSLHAHVVQHLQQHNPLRDSPDLAQHHPLTYIQELIMRETHKHQ
jgi:hypothetical protein